MGVRAGFRGRLFLLEAGLRPFEAGFRVDLERDGERRDGEVFVAIGPKHDGFSPRGKQPGRNPGPGLRPP